MSGTWEPANLDDFDENEEGGFAFGEVDGLVYTDRGDPAELRFDASSITNVELPPEAPLPQRRRERPAPAWQPPADEGKKRKKRTGPNPFARFIPIIVVAVLLIGIGAFMYYAIETFSLPAK